MGLSDAIEELGIEGQQVEEEAKAVVVPAVAVEFKMSAAAQGAQWFA